MNLKLKYLRMLHFKGAKEQRIDFSDETIITGDNEAGKTRIVDAYLWLLFGKDSQDKADFDIKPLDENNNVLHHLDCEVEAGLEIDGEEFSLMKVYKENWTKKRGSEIAELTNHTIDNYINILGVKKKEYDSFILEKIGDPELFKLLSDPMYFHSDKFNWEKRRKILFELVEEVSDQDIANLNEDFAKILKDLMGRDMLLYKKELNSKIRKIKDDIKLILPRIDEVERSKPDPVNENEIKKEISEIESIIRDLEKTITSEEEKANSENKSFVEWQQKKFDIEQEISAETNKVVSEHRTLYTNVSNKISEIKDSLKRKENLIDSLIQDKGEANSKIEHLTQRQHVLRTDWTKLNSKEFVINETDLICPTCKQDLPDTLSIEADLKNNFNTDKAKKLNEITTEGQKLGRLKEELAKEIIILNKKLEEANKEREQLLNDKKTEEDILDKFLSLEETISNSVELKKLNANLTELEKIKPGKIEVDIDFKQSRIRAERQKISELNSKLKANEQIEAAEKRRMQLVNEMKEKNKLVNELEKTEFNIDAFIKEKTIRTVESINKKFDYVKFRLYNYQLNEGEKPTCVTLIGGVPYASVNYASKINAGLEVIRVLSDHYDIHVPVMVDNRESVSKIVKLVSQVINLFKVTGQKELLIENK